MTLQESTSKNYVEHKKMKYFMEVDRYTLNDVDEKTWIQSFSSFNLRLNTQNLRKVRLNKHWIEQTKCMVETKESKIINLDWDSYLFAFQPV